MIYGLSSPDCECVWGVNYMRGAHELVVQIKIGAVIVVLILTYLLSYRHCRPIANTTLSLGLLLNDAYTRISVQDLSLRNGWTYHS